MVLPLILVFLYINKNKKSLKKPYKKLNINFLFHIIEYPNKEGGDHYEK